MRQSLLFLLTVLNITISTMPFQILATLDSSNLEDKDELFEDPVCESAELEEDDEEFEDASEQVEVAVGEREIAACASSGVSSGGGRRLSPTKNSGTVTGRKNEPKMRHSPLPGAPIFPGISILLFKQQTLILVLC